MSGKVNIAGTELIVIESGIYSFKNFDSSPGKSPLLLTDPWAPNYPEHQAYNDAIKPKVETHDGPLVIFEYSDTLNFTLGEYRERINRGLNTYFIPVPTYLDEPETSWDNVATFLQRFDKNDSPFLIGGGERAHWLGSLEARLSQYNFPYSRIDRLTWDSAGRWDVRFQAQSVAN